MSEAIGGHESQNETLDARWYGRLKKIVFDDYSKFSGEKNARELAKHGFLSQVDNNPSLDYPELEKFDFEGREAEALSLKNDVLELEQNPIVKKIYRTKINEILASLRMLKASKDGNDRKFSRYSDFLYGKPTEENTAYIVTALKARFSKKFSGSTTKQEGRQRLLSLLNNIDTVPTLNDFDKSILPKGQAIEGDVEDAEEIKREFLSSLEEIGVDDWDVVIDEKRGITGVSASQESKTVEIPSTDNVKERAMTRKKLVGLIEHEIKTHVLRRFNGERSKLQLLGLGLDRYLPGEEGVATYMEQQVTGADEFAGILKYLALAVAKGMDGKPRDFRGTYEVMVDYYLSALKDGDDLQDRANKAAYNDCVRIFRGSTCNTPGAVYTKDLAYFSGNKAVWHLVAKDSDVVKTFSIGKFDPTNKEHVYLLTELGILDQDLEVIEKEV